MAHNMTPTEVKQHFGVPGIADCYLLLCDGTAVNVRSQQVRALNLLHALNSEDKVKNKRIAVIGGGAAGITFAAGAASLDGEVTLFEKSSQLLHMQLGCWHRPLHPEIFSWPSDTAYRPVSHLPQLGWTTGRAHDVADTLLAQFGGIQAKLRKNLKVCCGTAVQVTPDRRIIPHNGDKSFDVVVLAIGFGFEKLPYRLPWNSYWRVDPLDQTLLGEDEGTPVVVVVGSGDGALIEIIRSCVQSFEQGALLDGILNAALDGKVDGENKALRDEVKRIEEKVPTENRFDEYCGLSNADVDKILLDNLRNTKVYWLIRDPTPFREPSLAINRFIVSRIIALQNRDALRPKPGQAHANGGIMPHPRGARARLIELIPRSDVVNVESASRGYWVTYSENGTQRSILCDNAIVRFGAERDVAGLDIKGLYSSIGRALAVTKERESILKAIRDHRDHLHNAHAGCLVPQWNSDPDFVERLEQLDPRGSRINGGVRKKVDPPKLRARFVKGFSGHKYTVYRIKVWLDALPHTEYAVRVTYDLHPEYGHSISRVAFGPKHEIWLNTNSNYNVRARTNDGLEWDLGSVAEALEAGYFEKAPVEVDEAGGEDFVDALNHVRTTREQKDRKEKQEQEKKGYNQA